MWKSAKIMLPILAAFLVLGFSTTVKAASLHLGGSFISVNPDCTADSSCDEFKIASENHPAWLHTLSITAAFSEGDGLCRIWAGLHDIDGGLGTGKSEQLIQAHATALSPANVAITLPTPIKIDPLDEMYVRGSVLNGAGECRVEAYFGVRVPPAEDD